MTIKSLYPSFYPTLDLNFANSRALDPCISFTRGSIATCVGSNGLLQSVDRNTARFDHDPTTGESLGLLVEEARTNLLLRSEDFATTWTVFAGTITTNTGTAPDGTTTADSFIANNEASTSGPRQDFSLADSTTYTASVFVKSAGLNIINIQFYNKANVFHGSKNLNLSTGQLSGSDSIGTTSVVSYGNGWYRFILSNLGSGTGANTPNLRFICASTGNGTSGIYLWGAQLEAGAFPTSYIPTTTAAATRAADVASITGSAFTSFYNQSEGTVFAEGSILNTGGNRFIADIADSGINEEIALYWNANFNSLVNDNGVGQANSFGGSVMASSRTLHSFGYKLNDFQGYGNGTALATDTSGTLPTVDRLTIGSRTNSSFWTNGTIRRLTYWPQRLSNEVLQRITQ